eukprot:gene11433-23915_t
MECEPMKLVGLTTAGDTDFDLALNRLGNADECFLCSKMSSDYSLIPVRQVFAFMNDVIIRGDSTKEIMREAWICLNACSTVYKDGIDDPFLQDITVPICGDDNVGCLVSKRVLESKSVVDIVTESSRIDIINRNLSSPSSPISTKQMIEFTIRINADLDIQYFDYITYEDRISEPEQLNILAVICSTRIFGQTGDLLPKIRLLVHTKQECKVLMDYISNRWNKVNLKFKYGRIVLKEDKTFEDQGIDDEAEITVTGGRSEKPTGFKQTTGGRHQLRAFSN